MPESFIDLCLSGKKRLDEIDDFIEAWHCGGGGDLTLRDAIGLSPPEYSAWLETPDILSKIVKDRQSQRKSVLLSGD
jgi:hypothetical protein